jgi:4'-phosphopantetheinyl transferase
MKCKRDGARLNDAFEILSQAGLSHAIAWFDSEIPDVRIAHLSLGPRTNVEPLLSVLSMAEVAAAAALSDAAERRHLIARRAFQRAFVATVCGWSGELFQLPLVHQRDQRTSCAVAPDMMFSFSSSQNHYCACASETQAVGIDIETCRPIENVVGLVKRFFTQDEVTVIEAAPVAVRDQVFQRIWTAKEAGLKALGVGIVSGLNQFTVSLHDGVCGIQHAGTKGWILDHPRIADDCIVAVVHRALK